MRLQDLLGVFHLGTRLVVQLSMKLDSRRQWPETNQEGGGEKIRHTHTHTPTYDVKDHDDDDDDDDGDGDAPFSCTHTIRTRPRIHARSCPPFLLPTHFQFWVHDS